MYYGSECFSRNFGLLFIYDIECDSIISQYKVSDITGYILFGTLRTKIGKMLVSTSHSLCICLSTCRNLSITHASVWKVHFLIVARILTIVTSFS